MNDLLQKIPIATNDSVSLKEQKPVKSENIPKSEKVSANILKHISNKDALKEAKKIHRALVRKIKLKKKTCTY